MAKTNKKPVKKTEDKDISEVKKEQYTKVPDDKVAKAAAEKSGGPEQQKPPSLKDILPDTYSKEDAEVIEKYAEAVIGRFTRYIKAIALFGSKKNQVKMKKTSDIDIAIIVDDTDARTMTRSELKDKLFSRLLEIGYPISKKIHPQPYLLTEFWQYAMAGNPVIYNVLRDGIAIFDTGYFVPMQMLLKMGHIIPSKETIDKHMEIGKELLKLGKDTMVSKLVYDLEQAVVSSAQAVLMALGYRPPGPNDVPTFVKLVLVNEKKLVDPKYVAIAEKIIRCFKDVEHKVRTTFTGAEWDEYLKDTEDFVEMMEKALKKIRDESGESYLFEAAEAKKTGKALKVQRPTDIDVTKEQIGKSSDDLKEELGQR